jgi:hypothetical protein
MERIWSGQTCVADPLRSYTSSLPSRLARSVSTARPARQEVCSGRQPLPPIGKCRAGLKLMWTPSGFDSELGHEVA